MNPLQRVARTEHGHLPPFALSRSGIPARLFNAIRWSRATIFSAFVVGSIVSAGSGCQTERHSERSSVDANANHSATDAMAEAQVVTTVAGRVTIHSLVAPTQVTGVTSHILELEDRLVVVDTQLTRLHALQLSRLCASLGKPIDRIIVTHGHPDHYFGIAAFASDIPVYALPSVRKQIAKRHRGHHRMHRQMEGDLIEETLSFPTHDLAIGGFDLGGIRVEIEGIKDAEDVEQVILWFPQQRVLIAQDLVSNGFHAFFGTGPVSRWVEALSRLKERQPTVVLAGHGPPGGPELLDQTAAYLERVSTIAAVATSESQLTKDVVSAFPNRKGIFLVEVSSLIIFRDRARSKK